MTLWDLRKAMNMLKNFLVSILLIESSHLILLLGQNVLKSFGFTNNDKNYFHDQQNIILPEIQSMGPLLMFPCHIHLIMRNKSIHITQDI